MGSSAYIHTHSRTYTHTHIHTSVYACGLVEGFTHSWGAVLLVIAMHYCKFDVCIHVYMYTYVYLRGAVLLVMAMHNCKFDVCIHVYMYTCIHMCIYVEQFF
jgi:hypothetical protein